MRLFARLRVDKPESGRTVRDFFGFHGGFPSGGLVDDGV